MVDHYWQHWIPDTYLSAWCDQDTTKQNPKRVYRYGKDGGYLDYRPLGVIFTSPDVYTVPGLDNSRDLRTERALGRLENSYAEIRNHILAQGLPIPTDARRNLIWFISALRNRSPAAHAQKQTFDARVLEVADDLADNLKAMSPEERASFVKRTRSLRSQTSRQNSIPICTYREIAAQPFGSYLPRNIVGEAEMLEQMHLTILRVPEVVQRLITSDNPVAWWDPSDPPPSRRPLGLGRRNIEITVPLTPYPLRSAFPQAESGLLRDRRSNGRRAQYADALLVPRNLRLPATRFSCRLAG